MNNPFDPGLCLIPYMLGSAELSRVSVALNIILAYVNMAYLTWKSMKSIVIDFNGSCWANTENLLPLDRR